MKTKLTRLYGAALKDLKANGFIGMDYNMAVICACVKRGAGWVRFGGNNSRYEEKLEYWSGKRTFCHLQVSSEDELIKHALKQYEIH